MLTFAHVICRPTEEEALAYLEYTARDNADWAAVDNLVRLQFAHAQSFPPPTSWRWIPRSLRHGPPRGFPLIGTGRKQVADRDHDAHRRTGIHGHDALRSSTTSPIPVYFPRTRAANPSLRKGGRPAS